MRRPAPAPTSRFRLLRQAQHSSSHPAIRTNRPRHKLHSASKRRHKASSLEGSALPKVKCGPLRDTELWGIQSIRDNRNEAVGRAHKMQGSKHLDTARIVLVLRVSRRGVFLYPRALLETNTRADTLVSLSPVFPGGLVQERIDRGSYIAAAGAKNYCGGTLRREKISSHRGIPQF